MDVAASAVREAKSHGIGGLTPRWRRKGVVMTVTAGRKPGARASRPCPARAEAVQQLSRADRVAQGKDARAVAPLESHAEFHLAGSRDPVGLLAAPGE